MQRISFPAFAMLVLFSGPSCSSCDELTGGGGATPPPQPPSDVLLERNGELGSRSPLVGRMRVDSYDLPVNVGDRLVVTVSSSAFDPAVFVTPPGAGTLGNDDWQGSREHAQIELLVAQAGVMKVGVTSYRPDAEGSYRLLVRRGTAQREGTAQAGAGFGTPVLGPGQTHRGNLGAGSGTLPDGRFYEQVLVNVPAGTPLSVTIRATGPEVPLGVVLDPQGRGLSANAAGEYVLTQPGTHRVQVMTGSTTPAAYELAIGQATGPGLTPTYARSHHQLPPQTTGAALTLGQAVAGELAETDVRLPSGEPADLYIVTTAQPNLDVSFEMTSRVIDPYLMIIGPDGNTWENDDFGGSTNAALQISLPAPGQYRVVATAYRDTERGAYELKYSPGSRAIAAPTDAQASSRQTQRGELGPGDAQLSSGEWTDTFELQWPAGQAVHIEARSTAFDTYLIVRPPTGPQQDNDDGPTGTDAVIDFVTTEAGTYRVQVTSYRPGEQGAYELVVSGPPAPGGSTSTPPSTPPSTAPPANARAGDIRGTLAAGDQQLSSGELADHHELTFTPGESVQLRLSSSAFDPYLIVRTPSGRQQDNDDLTSSTRDAGIDIPVAEAGTYTAIVTSYRPGETGAYTLSIGRGAGVPRPGGQGGRVFGLFAGISDYPPGTGDLPECANDAIKLAEALRESNLLTADRQVLLTDAQATVGNIRSAMQRMGSQVGPEDVFVFFYSGHGGQTGTTRDPRELDGTDEYLALYDGQLVDDELGQLFDGIRARIAVVAVDACYSGGLAKDIITRPGRMGLFSSEEDVLSAVATQFQAGGYLSHFLRAAVAGEADADPHDRVLTAGELTHFVYTQFGAHARDINLASAYQHLVVDRGAVRVDQVLWSYR